MPKVAPWRVAILAKMPNLAQMAKNHLAPCLAQTAKNRQRAGNIQNAANIQIGCQIFIWRLIAISAIFAKYAIFATACISGHIPGPDQYSGS